jgi:hypothetical protein
MEETERKTYADKNILSSSFKIYVAPTPAQEEALYKRCFDGFDSNHVCNSCQEKDKYNRKYLNGQSWMFQDVRSSL